MTENDFLQFSDCWGQACSGAGKEASPKAIEWAFEVLKDKSIEQIMSALIAHARDPESGQFIPKPADVIRHIDGKREDRKDAATIAWARVLENVNAYASVVFDDPAIHYAISVGFGGKWVDVCSFNADDFAYQEKRRSFITAYASFKPDTMNYPTHLIGIHEQDGADIKDNITFVGDKEKSRLVYRGGSDSGLQALQHGISSMPQLNPMKSLEK